MKKGVKKNGCIRNFNKTRIIRVIIGIIFILLLLIVFFMFSNINISGFKFINLLGKAVYSSSSGDCRGTRCFCSDSDEKDFYAMGFVRSSKGIFKDYCKDEESLVEYYCVFENVREESHYCEGGCFQGLCK